MTTRDENAEAVEAERYQAATAFVGWLERQILAGARGDPLDRLEGDPTGRFWLGRLAPKKAIAKNAAGERGERLEPCALGFRVKPATPGPWTFNLSCTLAAWRRVPNVGWSKSDVLTFDTSVTVADTTPIQTFHKDVIEAQLAGAGFAGLAAEFQVEVGIGSDGQRELTILLVNVSDSDSPPIASGRLFECALSVDGLKTEPFTLEALPDSFRYDRSVAAWGINCGVEAIGSALKSVDMPSADRLRLNFWGGSGRPPSFDFLTLAADPLGPSQTLVDELTAWGRQAWSDGTLARRAMTEHWSDQMREEAERGAAAFQEEVKRLENGIELLRSNDRVRAAFCGMNRAMHRSAAGKYTGWRPFQLGFLLANLQSIVDEQSEPDTVDIVWFSTGGGKTETYLGLLVTAALFDRMRGKSSGVTAWSRFPLRLLSLQQTQRFANALAAAELERRQLGLGGDAFSLGFLVGSGATPNSIKEDPPEHDPWDPDDESMPSRLLVLERCPFCRSDDIRARFDRRTWRVVHECRANACDWGRAPLPIYVVDDEIWRFLPTVVVGTLDKAASISMQASMRGLVGAPLGKCSKPGHGYTYAKRSARPHGCLVPRCKDAPEPIGMPAHLFGPSFRLQDELHLLRDSLGAVDAHYEGLYDELQLALCGRKAKVLASSATLTGYEKQSDVLYRRAARVFPQPEPEIGKGFWTRSSDKLMRRFVAVAPRGVTIEFATDRLLVILQTAIRRLLDDPQALCAELGIAPEMATFLVDLYGTNVVYGNTLRDLDAVMRSTETQLGDVPGRINVEQLTGRTDFPKVRETLNRLERPEATFEERLHVLPASSMMSHGVDIDRLNVMIMLGLPFGAADFIQATARVGRRWPALVVVVHKIGRERDASIYRSFPQFVLQGDRFVEPVPITRRSRRVLERTVAGLEFARLLMMHEPGTNGLTTAARLSSWGLAHAKELESDREAIRSALGYGETEEQLQDDLDSWFKNFVRNMEDPPSDARWPADLSPTGAPMLSLRDVEEQTVVKGEDPA